MDFSLSEEQALLRDSADKLVRDYFDVDRHRRRALAASGADPEAWARFAELGWLGLPFPESAGGFGGSAVDLAVLGEALGKGLVREPWLSTAVTCGTLLRLGGSEAQCQAFIPQIIEGTAHWAFAFAESGGGYDLASVACCAEQVPEGYRLNGSKIAVLDGDVADYLIVSARLAGSEAPSLFVVEAAAPGVQREAYARVDGGRAADITLSDVTLPADAVLGTIGGGLPLVEAALDWCAVSLGAEALGAMQVLLDTTVEYCKTRQQFGQPIGGFQALQHRMASMYLRVEETRSLLLYAAIQLDAGAGDAALACAALRVKVAEAGKFVAQQAVQLHGGIGMTDELVIGHHFKRLMLLGILYGDEDYHLRRYSRLGGFPAA